MSTQFTSWIEEIEIEADTDDLSLRPLDFSSAKLYGGDPLFEEFGEFNNHPYNYGDYN